MKNTRRLVWSISILALVLLVLLGVFCGRAAVTLCIRYLMPQKWAAAQTDLGIALTANGERGEGAESARQLDQAVAAFRAALEVRTRKAFPKDWAWTQDNLGLALRVQGERSKGADSVQLLGEAVVALHGALGIYTAEAFPHDNRLTLKDAERAEELLKRQQAKQGNSDISNPETNIAQK